MKEQLAKERYYITSAFASPGSAMAYGQEEMELSLAGEPQDAAQEKTAYMGGETHIAIRCIAEEISYMADYVFNDQGECEEVRFDPVPVGKKERMVLINL